MSHANTQPWITALTSPKPFTDPLIRTIQGNALRNWKALGLEVWVFGDEPGAAEITQALGLRHIPQVRRNRWGTPLLSDILRQARERAQTPWLLLVNADILFTPCLLRAVEALERAEIGPVLVAGRRWDVDIAEDLAFSGPWAEALTRRAHAQGQLNRTGMDYFLFPKDLPLNMPDMAIGRSGWDNWMVYYARSQGWVVVDATPDILAVHQNHHYNHLPGGQPPYKLEETRENVRLAGGEACLYTLWEATHLLVEGQLRPAPWHPMKPLRRIELALLREGFPERGWKRVALRFIRRKVQAALLRHPDWWRRYYGDRGCALA